MGTSVGEMLTGVFRWLVRRVASPFRVFAGEAHRWDEPEVRDSGGLERKSVARRPDRTAQESPEGEDAAARSMQAALLPTGFPVHERFELFGASEAARFVGGDYFDFFFTPRGTLMLVVADASGKGVPAAMFVAATRTILRDLGMAGLGPGAALAKANAMLLESNPQCMFVTAFLGEYDPGRGVLRFANAAHPAPVVIRGAGAEVQATEVRREQAGGGTVMGALAGLSYEEQTLELAVGDRLVVISDGVTEARDPAGGFLGVEGVLAACRRNGGLRAEALVRALLAEVSGFQRGRLHDDATVLVLLRKA